MSRQAIFKQHSFNLAKFFESTFESQAWFYSTMLLKIDYTGANLQAQSHEQFSTAVKYNKSSICAEKGLHIILFHYKAGNQAF